MDLTLRIKLNTVKSAKNINGIHMLFIDDDSNLLHAAKRLLKGRGYIVTFANGSSEAIALIKKTPDKFDVIVSDYSMPCMNGVELALEIGRILAGTPVILLTGTIDALNEKQIAEAGIAGVIKKPCKIEELDSKIRQVINKNNR